MTKKDYIEFAKMLRFYYNMVDKTPEERALLDGIVGGMIIIFKKDNPLFNQDKFLKAVHN